MNYDLYPLYLIFISYFCLPLFFKNKKFFFKKNFFFLKNSTINSDLIILQITYTHVLYFWLYVFINISWNTFVYTNLFHLIAYCLLNLITYTLYLINNFFKKNFFSWEIIFSLCGVTLFVPFFFLKLSLFQYFFITEIIAAFLFFMLYFKNIKNRFNIFNQKLNINVVYFQLILNSLVSVIFIICIIYINLYSLLFFNNLLLFFILLILTLKVGMGPAYFFKWYIFQSLSILIAGFMSYIYIFIYLFFIIFICENIYNTYLYFSIIFVFLVNILLLLVFFNRVTLGSTFLQYSSTITYTLLLLFIPIF